MSQNVTYNFYNYTPNDINAVIKEHAHKVTQQTRQNQTHLTQRKGAKIDIIRVINCLHELGFFTDKHGGNISKKQVFADIGQALNTDFTNYHINLSSAKAQSNADNTNNLAIFVQLHQTQQTINNR